MMTYAVWSGIATAWENFENTLALRRPAGSQRPSTRPIDDFFTLLGKSSPGPRIMPEPSPISTPAAAFVHWAGITRETESASSPRTR
jgi:hypothetical protein